MTDHRIVWTCKGCGKWIADHDGYLQLDMDEMRRYQRGSAEWDAEHDGLVDLDELLSRPEAAEWSAWHAACDPGPDRWMYCIDIERIRTHQAMLRWTAHLIGKNWFDCTDWHQVITNAVGRGL